jgi:hypothetical protein
VDAGKGHRVRRGERHPDHHQRSPFSIDQNVGPGGETGLEHL